MRDGNQKENKIIVISTIRSDMYRRVTLTIVLLSVSITHLYVNRAAGSRVDADGQVNGLDGKVYEFISSSTELTKPTKQSFKRESTDWAGRYYFANGRYSFVMMKIRRAYLNDPGGEDKLGYYSHAGEYKIKGDTIGLTKSISLDPLEVGRTTYFRFEEKENQLIFIQEFSPNIHDMSEGKTISIYKRLN